MRSMNRYCCYALLLMLLISHTALSSHVSSHNPADLTSCELCTGQANQAKAVPPSAREILPSETIFKLNTSYFALVEIAAALSPYHTRAPPAVV